MQTIWAATSESGLSRGRNRTVGGLGGPGDDEAHEDELIDGIAALGVADDAVGVTPEADQF